MRRIKNLEPGFDFSKRKGLGSARLNPKLGLTCEHFSRSVADPRSSKCSGSHPSNTASQDPRRRQQCPRLRSHWSWGFAAARPTARPTSRGRSEKKSKKPASPNPDAGSTFIGIAFALTPRTPTRRYNTERRSGPRDKRPRRSPCSNRSRSHTQRQSPACGLWASAGGRWPFPASLRCPQPRP